MDEKTAREIVTAGNEDFAAGNCMNVFEHERAKGYLERVEQEKLSIEQLKITLEKETLSRIEKATEHYRRELDDLKSKVESDFPHSCAKANRLKEQLAEEKERHGELHAAACDIAFMVEADSETLEEDAEDREKVRRFHKALTKTKAGGKKG